MTARSASPGPVDEAALRDAARHAAVVTDASALGLLAFDGTDAAEFLQGQLSNDVQALRPGAGQWTSYNSPKGRMLATLYLWRAHEATTGPRYLALVAADLIEPVAKRLAMFVLRSKVSVADATASHRFFGIGGPAAASAVRSALGDAPAAGQVLTIRDTTIVHWPDGRLVVVAPAATAAATFAALGRAAPTSDGSLWEWLAVRAGVPMIGAATQDRFVAQTANWDAIGGLDFRKGCYPGQEIVARTQHLGRLKERLFAFASDAEPPPSGTRLFSAAFGDQASGTVVNSARDGRGGALFLAVVQIEAVETGPIAIGATDGPIATREALPYEIPVLAAPRGRIGA